jgi:uncharacterized protein YabE (DUF348 family)
LRGDSIIEDQNQRGSDSAYFDGDRVRIIRNQNSDKVENIPLIDFDIEPNKIPKEGDSEIRVVEGEGGEKEKMSKVNLEKGVGKREKKEKPRQIFINWFKRY